MTSSLCNKNLFHQWCTFNWQIRRKYYVICHVNFRSNAFHSPTRWPRYSPIKGLKFLQFLDFFQQKKGRKRKQEKENFDSRRKTWGLISCSWLRIGGGKIDRSNWRVGKWGRERKTENTRHRFVAARRCGVEKWTDRVECCRCRHEKGGEWKTENR